MVLRQESGDASAAAKSPHYFGEPHRIQAQTEPRRGFATTCDLPGRFCQNSEVFEWREAALRPITQTDPWGSRAR